MAIKSMSRTDDPWLAVAQDVLAGKYPIAGKNKITESMQESLIIGLRGNFHPLARKALVLLGDWRVVRKVRSARSSQELPFTNET